MTIEERIKEARREGNFTAYVFTESELNELLEKVAEEAWHESNIITRIRANRAGCSKEVDDAMSDFDGKRKHSRLQQPKQE